MMSPRYLLFASAFLFVTAWMLRAFLPGALWGGVFAVSLWPLYCRLSEHFGRRLPAPALLFTLAFALLILAPLVYVGFEFARLYSAGSDYLAQGASDGLPPPAILAQLPFGDRMVAFWQDQIGHSASLIDAANHLSNGKLTSWLSSAAVQVSSDAVATVVMLVSLFFMLKNGDYIQTHYHTILAHWFTDKGASVVDKGISALRGTINGVVLIGLLEGVLLAVPLVLAGIQSGLLLGLAAGIIGVIPLVMPALILPCIAWLYFNGQTLFAVLTAIDLVIVWLVFENVIKPGIISNAVKVNPFLVLIGLIGGLQMLGPIGLFLGPALVAMATSIAHDLVAPP
ncbi:MAG: AI-2E family transporter [Pseudomonadota bacterium]|nr:AI-2E family transporter [Pseudomonadota bacterium]